VRGRSGNFRRSWCRTARVFRAVAVMLALFALPALADSGPPIPHFASLRSGDVDLRVGPGKQYPIEWKYQRRGLPVEVIAKSDVWRKIRDWEGTEGWVHQSMLVEQRTVIVRGEVRVLRERADPSSPAVARLEPKLVGRLLECEGPWCRIEVQGIRGWLRRTEIWGVYPDEEVR
jgi:SH3-like domain-containing protein